MSTLTISDVVVVKYSPTTLPACPARVFAGIRLPATSEQPGIMGEVFVCGNLEYTLTGKTMADVAKTIKEFYPKAKVLS